MADARRRVTPRPQLTRNPDFVEMSPEPGVLDEASWDETFKADPDQALVNLVAAHRSSDRRLTELAKRLAGRVAVDLARTTHGRRRGIDRVVSGRWSEGADLDVESSVLVVAEALAKDEAVNAHELVARTWTRNDHALTLVIDWSGSMGGDRLAAAALATAVMACRAPDDYSVIAVARNAIIVKDQTLARRIDDVIDDVLSLRGFGTTNLELGLLAAAGQLARSVSPRKVAVLLSDGNATVGGDPTVAARRLDELHVVAPVDSPPEAAALAKAGGGRYVELNGPSQIPETLLALMR